MPIAGLGPWELIIILLIVVVIFGAGRLSEIGGAVGRSVREFRSATRDEKDKEAAAAAAAAAPQQASLVAAPPPQQVAPVAPVMVAPVAVAAPPAPAPADTKCQSCGTINPPTQAFCGQCGTRLSRAA